MLMAAVMVNAYLIYKEFVPIPAALASRVQPDVLPLLSYIKTQRTVNLTQMGLSAADIDEAERHFKEYDRDKESFFKMFDHDDTEMVQVAGALCPGGELPQPYSALAVLVSEANRQRTVITSRTESLSVQPWFDSSAARNLYKEWQQVRDPQDDATVMAISAMLMGETPKALKREAPWGRELFSDASFTTVKRAYPPARQLVPEYFAMMHFMSELASDDTRGICN